MYGCSKIKVNTTRRDAIPLFELFDKGTQNKTFQGSYSSNSFQTGSQFVNCTPL